MSHKNFSFQVQLDNGHLIKVAVIKLSIFDQRQDLSPT